MGFIEKAEKEQSATSGVVVRSEFELSTRSFYIASLSWIIILSGLPCYHL